MTLLGNADTKLNKEQYTMIEENQMTYYKIWYINVYIFRKNNYGSNISWYCELKSDIL